MSNRIIDNGLSDREKIEALLRSTKRDGIEDLISFLMRSDFYTAPASTKYHSCHDGGLAEHSLNVYRCLYEKTKCNLLETCFEPSEDTWKDKQELEDSLIIIALLHDICKTYMYDTEWKNKKVYSSTGSKSDSNGRFDWVTVPGYTVNDKFPYGHGEKSVMMIEQFIKLKPYERYAIRWHMGFTEPKENWNTLSAAIKKYPLILAVHEADLEATYLLEEEE
jgi:hypothetical protein